VISIELEREVWHLLNDGKSIEEISRVTRVSKGTVRTIKRQPTLRDLKRKQDFSASIERKLANASKCISCGNQVTEWPCLICHPNSTIHNSGPLKPEDEGTIIKHGMQVSGHVIMPGIQKIILLVRIARNLLEMQKNNLLDSSVLMRHLVKDAKATLAVTEEEEKNGKRISSENEGTR